MYAIVPRVCMYIATRVSLSSTVWLNTGSEVDLCWLMRPVKGWSGICKAVIAVAKLISGSWFVLVVASSTYV